MSQRSIIEINHDQTHLIRDGEKLFMELLANALASGSDRAWEPLKRYGFCRVTQCHHSCERSVMVGRERIPIR